MTMHVDGSASVRPARVDDAGPLAALRWSFRAELAPGQETRDAFVARCTRWMRERVAAPDRRWRAWIAEAERAVVGGIWLQLVEKLPNPGAEPEWHGYVTNLFVVPAARGRGVGSALLRAALDACVAADVHEGFLWPTSRSRSLYRRHGFRDGGDVMLWTPRRAS